MNVEEYSTNQKAALELSDAADEVFECEVGPSRGHARVQRNQSVTHDRIFTYRMLNS